MKRRRHLDQDFSREKGAAISWLLLFALLVVGAVQERSKQRPVLTAEAAMPAR